MHKSTTLLIGIMASVVSVWFALVVRRVVALVDRCRPVLARQATAEVLS
jgi:hypothetical protein